MNFFEQQQEARTRTSLLVALFALAVLGIVIFTDAFILLSLFGADVIFRAEVAGSPPDLPDFQTILFASLAIAGLILGASWLKILSMKNGGHAIATSLGGKLIRPDTTEPNEKRLMNVVEEMAIASGAQIPMVYVLSGESSINAFVAGYEPGNAILAVTRGTLRKLSRDELQGVVAHEFSHIFNGDMRLNTRLIGFLYGIQLISEVGSFLMRSNRHDRVLMGSRRGRRGNGVAGIGFGLYVTGFIGLIMGRLIKSAVSRQREFLADASAVQFTRNGSAVSGVLKKIYVYSSLISGRKAEEVSHMFFAEGVHHWWEGWWSTHPDLVDRIKRIEPAFRLTHFLASEDFKNFSEDKRNSQAEQSKPVQIDENRKKHDQFAGLAALLAAERRLIRAPSLGDRIGQLSEAAIEKSKKEIDEIPENLIAAARSLEQVSTLILSFLSSKISEAGTGVGLAPEVTDYQKQIERLPRKSVYRLLDLAGPALRQLDPETRKLLRNQIRKMIISDRKLDYFEVLVDIKTSRSLEPELWTRRWNEPGKTIRGLHKEVGQYLDLLARSGNHKDEERAEIIASVAKILGFRIDPQKQPGVLTLNELESSIRNLSFLKPMDKQRLIRAGEKVILRDGNVTRGEWEFFCAVCDALGCPVPLTLKEPE